MVYLVIGCYLRRHQSGRDIDIDALLQQISMRFKKEPRCNAHARYLNPKP
jgi:hypothetical protein